MNKNQFEPLSGFRDLLSDRKLGVIAVLQDIFASFGYQPLETPIIERQALLTSQYGEDAQKLLYLFKDGGGREIGLRYDLTLPLARFVAANRSKLTLPFKRSEIGPVFRAERAQRGRFRQFTQADIDIVGCASYGAEREALQIIALAASRLSLSLKVMLNDRRIVELAIKKIGVAENKKNLLFRLLDKKDKLEPQELKTELKALGLTEPQLRLISSCFLSDEADEATAELLGRPILREISELVTFGRSLGLDTEFVPSVVRGLDYYTGTVLEAVVSGSNSSVIAGGRYDTLVEKLIAEALPAFGISFGVDRLLELVEELGAELALKPLFVARFQENLTEVDRWIAGLRARGRRIDSFLDYRASLSEQLKYASRRGYSRAILPLLADWQNGEVIVRDLETGLQKKVSYKNLPD